MVGRTGPLEGSGAEVRGHLLQSLSHAAAQSLNWVGSLLHLPEGSRCTFHQACKLGVEELLLGRDPGGKGSDDNIFGSLEVTGP
jgi:hypothetical protein